MTVPRLYLPSTLLERETIRLEGEDHHIISRVLRLRPGSRVEILDGSGLRVEAVVEDIGRKATMVRLGARVEVEEDVPRIHLWQALPAGRKMEAVIRGAVEMGAKAVNPFISARSAPWTGDDGNRKLSRWRRIAVEASRLSGRAFLPQVRPPARWPEVLRAVERIDAALYADEKGGRTVSEALDPRFLRDILLLVGPEGGFEERERKELQERGAVPVTLGKNVLRVEHAGMVFMAAVLCRLGRL